jgi:hypothetical protein
MPLCEDYYKYFSEDLPEGFHWVVIGVEQLNPKGEYSLVTHWEGCILNEDNNCILRSFSSAPAIGSSFYSENLEPKTYKLLVRKFHSLREATRWRNLLRGNQVTYYAPFRKSTYLKVEGTPNDFTVAQAPQCTSGWSIVRDDTGQTQRMCYTKQEQSNTQKAAQSLASKNATEITKLENKLRELRIIQKFLKSQR